MAQNPVIRDLELEKITQFLDRQIVPVNRGQKK